MNKLLSKILLIGLLSNSLVGQNINLDSLVSKSQNDSNKAVAIVKYAETLKGSDLVKEVATYKKALEFANKTNNNSLIGNVKVLLSSAYIKINKLDSAEKIINSAYLNFFEISSDVGIAKAYATLGKINYIRHYPIKAYQYWEEALKLYLLIGDELKIAGMFNNIGVVYSSIGDNKKALYNFIEASKIFEKLDLKKNLTDLYGNIGITYNKLKDYNNAEKYINKSIYLKNLLKDELGIAISETNLANLYIDKKEYEKALELTLKAVNTKNKYNYLVGIIPNYISICNIYIAQEKYESALDYALKGLNIAKENKILENEVDFLDLIVTIHKKTGKIDKAKIFEKDLLILTDSLNKIEDKEKQKNILNNSDNLKVQSDSLKKPINENKLAEKPIFTNNLIIIAIILGVILLAIFIFIRKR